MFQHITVLLNESVDALNIKSDGVYVDCTLGGAGHSSLIVKRLGPNGTLIGLDQDNRALEAAKQKISQASCRVILHKANFQHVKEVVKSYGIDQVDGVLFDLGVSSPQLDEGERGFSYHEDAPLDMRMDQEQELTAYQVVNQYSEEELSRILFQYGEEKFSRRISHHIVQHRMHKPIERTAELAEIIKEAIPAATRRKGPHPARRSFQAIRIAVNNELGVFEEALQQVVPLLRKGGRVAVISFHSLEDRICKHFFQEQAVGCICPKHFPVCVCDHKPALTIITRKPIVPTNDEIEVNARARSAKLRVAEKL
ncbi:16S rRNA (cytosine(1402)-N(4))-methyltransferase RsmH [Shimazuella sp. AN120528]|uniref:16S rRNA (cytosine(1402)-N(4))-methyltransferase RsmH n=1 Tax=Shimazuella soli TaxID=1892854 RepID=UPI001F0EE1F6|nr:16S rRNA (cytosine(1402)-N(4))-methyltransferase RsmH [Shimazuella soli]MCH5584034.1 16S rRNA (cytosine(1402)-N(4))-methyltransferase RsmH [Shimazuella soli]